MVSEPWMGLSTKISKTTPCKVAWSGLLSDPAKNILTRRANHRHIFIVARIKPAPENPLRALNQTRRCQAIRCRARRTWPPQRTELADSQGPADRRAPGEDDGQAEPESTLPRHCASHPSSTFLQTLSFKHLKPTQPSARGRGHITGSPEGVRKYL